jgi:hypothetical protein
MALLLVACLVAMEGLFEIKVFFLFFDKKFISNSKPFFFCHHKKPVVYSNHTVPICLPDDKERVDYGGIFATASSYEKNADKDVTRFELPKSEVEIEIMAEEMCEQELSKHAFAKHDICARAEDQV